jgi:hypothetical protein
MRLAVMQPYLFPYIGYFQLVATADEFVIYDNVQYIKRGWVNRNQILGTDGGPQKFTAPVFGASQTKNFNEVSFAEQNHLLRTFSQAYGKAPYFDAVQPLIERVLRHEDRRIASLVNFSLQEILAYLDVPSRISRASDIALSAELRGAARILAICEARGATSYVNLPGGTGLYQTETFRRHGIELWFLKPRDIHYAQFGGAFVPKLSIVDVLMFNPPQAVKEFLTCYELSRQ